MDHSWQQTRAQTLAAMTAQEPALYDKAYEMRASPCGWPKWCTRREPPPGLSQAELARRMGTCQPAIAAIENGARTPTVELLDGRARALGGTLQISIEPAA